MKKFLFAFFTLAAFVMSMTSCTTAEAVTYEEPSVEYIVTYGTPYYYNGVILYYHYNNYWYYPKHHRVYYHHRHHVKPPKGTGPNRPHRPHGYEPNGHKHGNGNGHHGNVRPGSRPSTVHGGHHGGGHHENGGRPSSPPRRR